MHHPPSVSIVINTQDHPDALARCLKSIFLQDYLGLEVIVVDSGTAAGTAQMLQTSYPSVVLLPVPDHTGFAKGKNLGVRAARGDICIFISDTSEFMENDAIRKSVDYFLGDETLACLSMRIVDRDHRIIRKYIPRRDRKIITRDTPGANFMAAACAVRRLAFLEAGGLWEDLDPHFGGEPELSYRLLDRGYGILHTPHITVRCHEVRGRRKVSRRLYSGTRNTPWIALRSLPWYSVASLTLLSWGYFFLIALRDMQLPVFFKGILHSVRRWPAVYCMRRPIGTRAVAALWKHSGIVLY